MCDSTTVDQCLRIKTKRQLQQSLGPEKGTNLFGGRNSEESGRQDLMQANGQMASEYEEDEHQFGSPHCPAPLSRLPQNILEQQALRGCPLVVKNAVQQGGTWEPVDEPGVCSTSFIVNNKEEDIFGWQLQGLPAPHFDLQAALGALIIEKAAGTGFRLVNAPEAAWLSGRGMLNFSLAMTPSAGNKTSWNATLDASLDWSAVVLNGQECSKVPASSFLLNDCSDNKYEDLQAASDLPPEQPAGAALCLSLWCCGSPDFQAGSSYEPPGSFWDAPVGSGGRSNSSSSRNSSNPTGLQGQSAAGFNPGDVWSDADGGVEGGREGEGSEEDSGSVRQGEGENQEGGAVDNEDSKEGNKKSSQEDAGVDEGGSYDVSEEGGGAEDGNDMDASGGEGTRDRNKGDAEGGEDFSSSAEDDENEDTGIEAGDAGSGSGSGSGSSSSGGNSSTGSQHHNTEVAKIVAPTVVGGVFLLAGILVAARVYAQASVTWKCRAATDQLRANGDNPGLSSASNAVVDNQGKLRHGSAGGAKGLQHQQGGGRGMICQPPCSQMKIKNKEADGDEQLHISVAAGSGHRSGHRQQPEQTDQQEPDGWQHQGHVLPSLGLVTLGQHLASHRSLPTTVTTKLAEEGWGQSRQGRVPFQGAPGLQIHVDVPGGLPQRHQPPTRSMSSASRHGSIAGHLMHQISRLPVLQGMLAQLHDNGPAYPPPPPPRQASWLHSCLGMRSKSEAVLLHLDPRPTQQLHGDDGESCDIEQQSMHSQAIHQTPQHDQYGQNYPLRPAHPLHGQPVSDAALWNQQQQQQQPYFELLALHRSISSAYMCTAHATAAHPQQELAQGKEHTEQAAPTAGLERQQEEALVACNSMQQAMCPELQGAENRDVGAQPSMGLGREHLGQRLQQQQQERQRQQLPRLHRESEPPLIRPWQPINFSEDLELERKIGSGSFGTVYAARWRNAPSALVDLEPKGTGMRVAVKMVRLMDEDGGGYSSRSLDSLKQEIQVLSRLQHPHIISFFGACLSPPNVLIVEQLAEHGSLLSMIHSYQQQQQPLSTQQGSEKGSVGLPYFEVLRLGRQVASAMAYLHSSGVVHRDLKAGNILIGDQGNALVADLGLAKFRTEGSFLSTRNAYAGTPAYMAPEQFEGRRTSEKVDQYAFGVLLWQMLTGQQPWRELDHPMQIIFTVNVQCQRLPISDTWPLAMADLLRACWQELPERRPAFTVIEEQLRACLEELGSLASDRIHTQK